MSHALLGNEEIRAFGLGFDIYSITSGDNISSTVTAQQLEADDGAAMPAASKAAFSATHSVLLTAAAVLMALLTILVYVLLRQTRPVSAGHH